MCNSVFCCSVKELSALLFLKKFKVSLPINLLAEPIPEVSYLSLFEAPEPLSLIKNGKTLPE